MFTLFFIVPIVLAFLFIRLVLRALGLGRRYRSPFGYGCRSNYGSGYRSGRRRRFGSGWLSILALIALDRLFTRRF